MHEKVTEKAEGRRAQSSGEGSRAKQSGGDPLQ
jgi:hypothetical protein